MTSILKLRRPVRRRFKKIAQFHSDANYRRRVNSLLLLHEGLSQRQVSSLLNASRTSMRNWLKCYHEFGEAGLVPEQQGRKPEVVTDQLCTRLIELVQEQPSEYGWIPSRWTSELLASQVNRENGSQVHALLFADYYLNWVYSGNGQAPLFVYRTRKSPVK